MRTIAALTMVFLPGAYISGLFGMAFFNLTDNGDFVVSQTVWIYVVITVQLTLMTFALWLAWERPNDTPRMGWARLEKLID